ncbi:MAG: hypothetical protein JOZ29_15320 [Deltaproteobacteria bacterium]|nr:hypothetical protein [Deltaproteobacteria bacterium]MBV8453621.1 hypothetical protein [Deltaproteobacteria bacterium]
MASTLKKGAAQLRELTEATTKPARPATDKPASARKSTGTETVLIGAHFPRAVRRSLAQLQADPRNDGKKINDLLAEALNDLFAKYNVPQTAHIARDN